MPLIEPGSLVVGELKLVDERAALVEQLQVPRCAVCGAHGYIGGEICPLFLDVHPECFPLHEYTTIADRARPHRELLAAGIFASRAAAREFGIDRQLLSLLPTS